MAEDGHRAEWLASIAWENVEALNARLCKEDRGSLVLACSVVVARVQNPWAKRVGIAMGVVGAAWFWFVLAA